MRHVVAVASKSLLRSVQGSHTQVGWEKNSSVGVGGRSLSVVGVDVTVCRLVHVSLLRNALL